MSNEPTVKLSLWSLVKDTLNWSASQKGLFWGSAALVWAFLSMGFCWLGGWSNSWFLLWLAVFYYFWYGFVRLALGRDKFWEVKNLWSTLIPFTRILFIAFMVATLFVLIPFAPYVMFSPVDVKEIYSYCHQRYMQDSDAYDLVLNIGLILALPVVFIRPVMAWFAACLGRSWSMMTAWEKTRGLYFLMCVLALLADAAFWALRYAVITWAIPCVAVWVVAAPLVVFAVLLLLRMYAVLYAAV